MSTLDEVDPTAIAEKHFEVTALTILQKLYSNCHVFPYKPLIRYAGGERKPDLALVDKNMGYWFVIEVETASHSFQGHVLPQVTAFRFGEYGEQAAQKLSENLAISPQEARTLIKYIPQYFAVVSNSNNEEWEKALVAENIQYMSIASYQDIQGQTAHMVTGALKPAERSLCFGTVYATFQAIRVVQTPFWLDPSYRITDTFGTAMWTCTINEGCAWLTKRKGILGFDDKAPIQFLLNDDGSLLLRALA